MDESTLVYAALAYLMGFRLLIILLGGLCIFLGYRLFVRAMPQSQSGGEGSKSAAEMEAQFGEHRRLSLKNAAPGTFFAAFGSAIVIVVLSGSPPAFSFKKGDLSLETEKGDVSVSQAVEAQRPIVGNGIDKEAGKGAKADSGRVIKELTVRGDDVPETAEAAHQHADELFKQLVKWEKQAVNMDPAHAEYQDSLASLYFMAGQFELALRHQEQAVALNPEGKGFQQRLKAYQHIQ